jgi:hypothetical protein
MTNPGWYPQNDGQLHYWDGTQWTGQVADGQPPAAKLGASMPLWLGITLPIVVLILGCVLGGAIGALARPESSAADQHKIDALERQIKELKEGGAGEPSSSPEASEPADAATVTYSGEGDVITAPQHLEGDYRVDWTTGGDCTYYGHVEPGSFMEAFSASAATSGTSYLYDLTPNDYYLDVITGPAPSCPWTATFTPQ